MADREITVLVNGTPRTATAEDRRTLAEFLREDCGLTGTHFEEETGLDPGNVSTARDYAKLMSLACKNELIPEITSTPHYEFRTSRGYHVLANTDRLRSNYQHRAAAGGRYDPAICTITVRVRGPSNSQK